MVLYKPVSGGVFSHNRRAGQLRWNRRATSRWRRIKLPWRLGQTTFFVTNALRLRTKMVEQALTRRHRPGGPYRHKLHHYGAVLTPLPFHVEVALHYSMYLGQPLRSIKKALFDLKKDRC